MRIIKLVAIGILAILVYAGVTVPEYLLEVGAKTTGIICLLWAFVTALILVVAFIVWAASSAVLISYILEG